MFANDPVGENFEDALRSIAAELGQYLERSLENVDLDDISDRFGVDSSTAAEWAKNAGGRLALPYVRPRRGDGTARLRVRVAGVGVAHAYAGAGAKSGSH